MLEATLKQGQLLKRIIDSIKELINDANFDCNSSGISLQAMDTAHISLVHLLLRAEAFDPYRCDRTLSLGVNITNFNKILKCASNDDQVTLKANDEGDSISLAFESGKKERYSEFEVKLIEIEADQLGIPDTEYSVLVHMPSAELKRICSDMAILGDTVTITATKEGVKFSASGEIASGSITVRQDASADDEDDNTLIELNEPVSLTFALKYLNIFCKSASLSNRVALSLSKSSPLLVEFKFQENGHIRYYLAPKMENEGEENADDE
ncbi:proliferating cell nuclear antigen [Acrasis kona]|uniref:DNA sliding clamp PCNA n=1 Tax=Acrasis kona TaxID=1008807 RepID=A0AAW2ZEW5_9EUKA